MSTLQRNKTARILADILTISRIASAIILLPLPLDGCTFWAIYAWGGLSDMLDGSIARRSGSASQKGAVLDSLADWVFFCACLLKFIPWVHLPLWVWIWTAAIALLRILIAIKGWMRHHQVWMPHTFWNKATGLSLFLLPFISLFMSIIIPAVLTCIFASVSVVLEKRSA